MEPAAIAYLREQEVLKEGLKLGYNHLYQSAVFALEKQQVGLMHKVFYLLTKYCVDCGQRR